MKKKIAIIIILYLIIIGILFVILFNFKGEKILGQNTLNDIGITENLNNIASNHNANLDNVNTSNSINLIIENEENKTLNNHNEDIQINLIVNNKKFKAVFYNNSTVKELISKFPMTLNMSELHSNEKYNYLDFELKTNSYVPSRINAGNIKLYGDNCLVVFYKSFENSYNYTDLGYIENVNSFISELGNGSVTITFELNMQ